MESENPDINMPTGDEAWQLIVEVEEMIEAIKNGDIEGEYLEF